MAYHYVTKDANCITDDMARLALEVQAAVTFWDGQVLKDAPRNQAKDIYKQQGEKSPLHWAGLPKPIDLKLHLLESKSDITVAHYV